MQSKLELQQYTADIFQGQQHWHGRYAMVVKNCVAGIATYVCVALH